MNRAEFIDAYKDTAMEQMALYGIPASITLAQAILESENGNSELAVKYNNFFGITANREQVKSGNYVERYDGSHYNKFVSFNSVQDSFDAHSKLLLSAECYKSLLAIPQNDYVRWCDGLKACGYAEDPRYSEKLQSIIERNHLEQYDKLVLGNNYTPLDKEEAVSEEDLSGEFVPYSFPIDCQSEILVKTPYGVSLINPSDGREYISNSLILSAADKNVLATEDGARVVSTDQSKGTIIVQLKSDDDSKLLLTYQGIGDIRVSNGETLAAGQIIGKASEELKLSLEVQSPDGRRQSLDPTAYIADLSHKGNIDKSLYYNGTDLLAEYRTSSQSQADVPMDAESYLRKILSSEDCGLGASGGVDSTLLNLIVSAVTSILTLVSSLDNLTEQQKMKSANEVIMNNKIDLSSLMPKLDVCELRLDDASRPILHIERDDSVTDRPLSPGEITRLSDMLSNNSLSNETQRSNISFYLTSLIAQSNISMLYEQELSRTLQTEISAGRGQSM